MDTVLRSAAIYFFLLVLFRIAGQRTLSELSNFDLVLLLIVSEATQNALIGDDFSVVNGMTAILTLVLIDLALAYAKKRVPRVEKLVEGTPVIVVAHGKLLRDSLDSTHVTVDDILQSAREKQGLENMAQIKYAVLEPAGGISIVPMDSKPG
ncbi:DUF421 domain-containing protein [Ideonella sp. BN130291]|uniref:DUF421 domain-containing protein n=1 Tax=Ideonella sp. BN130291 TaxID=3112940 RepID=UPI002E26FEC7|nr:YetF domain-containing protein [Ideonella sp. BN130291]